MSALPEGSAIAALLNVFQYLELKPEAVAEINDLTISGVLSKRGNFQPFDAGQERQYQKLLAACASNPDFANIMLLGESVQLPDPQTGEPFVPGGLKGGFYGDPSTGALYTAFRGTGRREWLDNAIAGSGLQPYSPQQKQALAFFDGYVEAMAAKTRKLSGRDPFVILTGHSKGGNKAQFTAMLTQHQDLVRSAVSMDGPTMSPEAMKYMIDTLGAEQFERLRTEKLSALCGDNDFVHPLFHNLGSDTHEGRRLPSALIPPANTVYLGREPQLGKSLPNLHMADFYVTGEGRLTGVTGKGPLVGVMENISIAVMGFPPEARQLITETLMWSAQWLHHDTPLGGEKFDPAKFTAGLSLTVFSIAAGLTHSLTDLTLLLAEKAARAIASLVAGIMTQTHELIVAAGKLGLEIKQLAPQVPDVSGAERLGTLLVEAAQIAEAEIRPEAEKAGTERPEAEKVGTERPEPAPGAEKGGPERQEGKEFATMSFAERLQWARERSAQSGREQGGGTLLTDKRAAAGREGIMPAEREAGGR